MNYRSIKEQDVAPGLERLLDVSVLYGSVFQDASL